MNQTSMTTDDQVREIKQSFRLLMNGTTAASQREKGLNYHLNWGCQLPHLMEMASSYPKDYHLAVALWKENIRECKILASMLMPHDEMPAEVCDIWMEQMPSQEIAEITSMQLFQHLPYAAQKAYEWIASDNELKQICGYNVLGRFFLRGQEPNERGINELIDQAGAALNGKFLSVRKAAANCLYKLMDINEIYERIITNSKIL